VNKHIREYIAAARSLGVTDIAIVDRGGRHPLLTGKFGDVAVKRPIPRGSSPKWRARANWVSGLARDIGTVTADRVTIQRGRRS
jgi:hypothetical protein